VKLTPLKPHLRKSGGWWECRCVGYGHLARGSTYRLAWDKWLRTAKHIDQLRKDFRI
jgi:hypothetical protein